MKKNIRTHLVITLSASFVISSCGKDFLERKPSSDIIHPTTLDEFQLLLENMQTNNKTSALPTLSSDEYEFVSIEAWQSTRNNAERNCYIWNKDIFEGEVNGGDWNTPYESIFYSNNVLDGLMNVSDIEKEKSKYAFIKGWALFNRAFAYHDLIRNFSPAYDPLKSTKLLGVPLRLKASVDEILPRSTQQEVYDQIIKDLTEAKKLLSEKLPENRNRPSKISCYALLARLFLNMRDYEYAEQYADSALSLYSQLINYNTVSQTNSFPFSITHPELIYTANTIAKYPAFITSPSNSSIKIPNELLDLYETNDLRLPIYYSQRPTGDMVRKRGYTGTGNYAFTGLATDELYMIKAECSVRRNDIPVALEYLNALLINRYKEGTFTPLLISDPSVLLSRVLVERRKELSWRGLRWDDIKRLNMEGANIVLTRTLGDQTYSLPPNDPRYVFPIPDNEINFSNLEQNIR